MPDGALGVLHAPHHGFQQGHLQAEQVVDAKAVRDGHGDVAHSGQVLAQGHDVGAFLASGQKEPAVRKHDHRTARVRVSRRAVDVHEKLFIHARGPDVAAIQHIAGHFHLLKNAVAVALPIALGEHHRG